MKYASAAVLLALAGCTSTQEIPLSANRVQLEVSGTGRLGAGAVPQQTLRRAAEVTLREGYTHFVLESPQTQTGRVFAGVTYGQPMLATTRTNSVTVVM